jgi:hypothetical protein
VVVEDGLIVAVLLSIDSSGNGGSSFSASNEEESIGDGSNCKREMKVSCEAFECRDFESIVSLTGRGFASPPRSVPDELINQRVLKAVINAQRAHKRLGSSWLPESAIAALCLKPGIFTGIHRY